MKDKKTPSQRDIFQAALKGTPIEFPEGEEIIIISKSQQKREAHALTALGSQILDLSPTDIQKLPLDDELERAVKAALDMKMGARKRQVQFIGKLLRNRDTDALQKAVEDLLHARASKGKVFKQQERWRERLLNEGHSALTEFCAAYPGADVQRLRQLIRNASKEQAQNKPPKSFRELFKEIRRLDEQSGGDEYSDQY